MIAFIRGKIAAYGTDWLIIENNGMGWQMAYPHTENVRLGSEVSVYTYMHVTENDVSLFGFESQEEKELFLRLISVKGLGPRTAMNMLAHSGYNTVIKAIEEGNVAALKKMPGIGAKSASQIVLDLKGKLVAAPVKPSAAPAQSYPPEIADALEGLKNLGYKPGELGPVASKMLESPGLTTAEYLRIGLKFLSR
ncbi:MAG: Holliday junction branch migration protein RuvA [Erysipelotrichaceae bacterium]|jgi:Holliday junction DNA helicase RuvA|nr:Holliday junction branch migration protein RuvA [Erysipelotrichaceae bacterium]MDO5109097.1 Holliday junction branch migration protein RuvA [Erysipelotrichaceae bacterium]